MTHHHADKHEAHRRLVARMRQHAEDVSRLTAGLDEEALATRTIPGKWSLKELVCHLWRVQQVFAGRVETMLIEEQPAIASYDPEGDAEFDALVAKPAVESIRGFLADRERVASWLERLSAAEWHRRGRHPEFPHYDVHFQVEYLVHHEAHHIYQLLQRRVPLGKLPH